MLKEIYCDKFISYGNVRDKIVFNPILNVIEGSDSGKNSIGKSTFLMCIDFCFGGSDYVKKLTDVKKNVGTHTICFAFEFDKPYYFCRSTDNPDVVSVCDENYTPTGNVLKIKEFTDFLKEKYEIPIAELSFRQIVSRFIRVYNRENLNEQLPLRSHDDEPEKVSISELIKLFGLFREIRELNDKNETVTAKKDAFKKAQDHDIVPRITETQYKENLTEIEKLLKEAEDLADRSDKGILELSAEKAELIAKLKAEISTLKRKRSKLYTQLDLYKKDAEYEPANYQKDFQELTTYFDNVNIENLQEIENFHIQLSAILKKELKKTIDDVWININLLTEAIKSYESELEQIQNTSNVSKVVLKSYAAIDRQIELLKKINAYHLQKKEIDEEAKKIAKELEEKIMLQIAILLTDLNGKMKEINNTIYNEGTSAPILYLPTSKNYKFETPNDLGTGSKYKGMIIFDLAVLSLTSLPVIIHDSVMFANMEFERVEKTFMLYTSSQKQIFVAVDKTTQLNEEAKNTIRANQVLLLSPNGNELFGCPWNKQTEES